MSLGSQINNRNVVPSDQHLIARSTSDMFSTGFLLDTSRLSELCFPSFFVKGGGGVNKQSQTSSSSSSSSSSLILNSPWGFSDTIYNKTGFTNKTI